MELGEPFARGNTAALYLCEGRVVKLFDGSVSAARVASERDKQRHARACGLPVPEVYEMIQIGGRLALVMEHIDGATLGARILAEPGNARAHMAETVVLQCHIHGSPAGGLERMNDRLRRQLSGARRLSEPRRTDLLRRLRDFEGEAEGRAPMLCHGDFHAHNVLASGARRVVIDWADASAGETRADACRSYLLYTHFSAELAELYLRLYCAESGQSPGEVLAWLPILAGARLAENMSEREAGHLMDILREVDP